MGNGVDLEKFNPDRFDNYLNIQKRTEIGIPTDAVAICIIARLVKEKGFLELFQAFNEIMKNFKNVWLVIIGPQEPEKNDRISASTFKEYGIEKRTIYLGSRDDIAEILSCSDIYTLPSWREGFPRSAIEAAAMGLPIVATDIRGCRQVVENGINGVLIPFNDSNALKKALLKLINDSELRAKMGKAGLQKAKKEFSEDKICQIVLDTYKLFLDK